MRPATIGMSATCLLAVLDRTHIEDPMSVSDDRKMFARLRRAQISPELKLVALLTRHQGGATAEVLTDDLAGAGMVVGSRAPIIKRIRELLDELERAGQVERVPDGRYRTVRAR